MWTNPNMGNTLGAKNGKPTSQWADGCSNFYSHDIVNDTDCNLKFDLNRASLLRLPTESMTYP
jgi:hypothetical protein